MEYTNIRQVTLGQIVTNDFRSAGIFKEAGLDFCCGGAKTLEQACSEKNINVTSVLEKIKELDRISANPAQNFKDWDLDFLADYIVNTHHKYVLKMLPDLDFYTKKIASVHSAHHPELIEIESLFVKINSELLLHLEKEEKVLFPAIKEALKTNSSQAKEIIHSEITRMNGEHEFAGGAMDKINVLSGGYKVPSDGCNTYQVTYQMLRQFEDDLHIHVHLENNILFPKALVL